MPSPCTERGWLGEDIVPEMVKFAGFLAQEYGGKIDWWATLNEPFAVILAGYVSPTKDRTNPPGISDLEFEYAEIVINRMLDAHAGIYDALHKYDTTVASGEGKPVWVGLVPNLASVHPQDPDSEDDAQAVKDAHYLYNQYFLNALIKGEWDKRLRWHQ